MWLLSLLACDPYHRWPDPESVFPWVVSPEEGLEPYEEVRYETETWETSEPSMTGLYIQKSFYHRTGAPPEVLAHFEAVRPAIPPLGDGLRLAFAGDVMYVDQERWSEYATPTGPLFEGAALRVGNLETPTSPEHPTEPRALGTYAFNAPPELIDGLPLDVLQLTNNHSLDAGEDGLANTLAEVAARGRIPTGVDTQARVQVEGREIALLAYTWGLNDRITTDAFDLHVVPFGHLHAPVPLDRIAEDLRDARADGALAVVLVHWGFEYEYFPDAHFMRLARQIVALGADLVVGHGPHVAQPAELCAVNRPEVVPGVGTCSVRTDDGVARTAAILYSLANFGSEMATVPTQVGILVQASLGPDGVTGLGWAGVAAVEEAGHPRLRPLDEVLADPDLAAESARLDAHLGAGWRR